MKRSFWEVGQWLQATAKTAEDANERFECSCNRCNKQHICNEYKCPIFKAHETRLLSLEAERTQKSRPLNFEVKTRSYKKASPETKIRKALLSYLTKLSKLCTNRNKQLIIDDASVMVELEEYTMAYWILKNGKLVKTAERIMELIRKYKEEN